MWGLAGETRDHYPFMHLGKTGSSGLDASNYRTVALLTQRARTLSSQLASALRGDSRLQTFKPFFQESKDGSLFEKDSEH